jgi:hypothetical protein
MMSGCVLEAEEDALVGFDFQHTRFVVSDVRDGTDQLLSAWSDGSSTSQSGNGMMGVL